MDNPSDSPRPDPPPRQADYDDPHFHDEDIEVGFSEDGERRPNARWIR